MERLRDRKKERRGEVETTRWSDRETGRQIDSSGQGILTKREGSVQLTSLYQLV